MDRLLPLSIVFALLAACGPTGFPPARPHDVGALEAPVRRLVDRRVAEVEAAPADPRAHARLGAAYQGNGLWLAAAESFAQAAALDPAEPLWPYYGARAMDRLGRWTECRALLEDALERDAACAPALVMRGWMQLEDGDEAGARASFEAARAARPNRAEPLIGLATLALEDGDAAEAKRLADAALQLDRTAHQARFVRGRALVQLGDVEEGRREMEAGVDANDKAMATDFTREVVDARVNRVDVIESAVAHRAAGRQEVALQLLDALRADFPDDPVIENNRAGVLSDLGRTDDAIAALEGVVRRDEDLSRSWTSLARLYLRSGREQDALDAAQRAVSLDRLDHLAWSTIADVKRRQRDAMGSFEAIRTAIDLDPDNGEYRAMMGNLYAMAGQDEPALQCFARAVELLPEVPQMRLALASTAIRMARFDEAREALEAARRLDPDVEGLAALERKLAEQSGR